MQTNQTGIPLIPAYSDMRSLYPTPGRRHKRQLMGHHVLSHALSLRGWRQDEIQTQNQNSSMLITIPVWLWCSSSWHWSNHWCAEYYNAHKPLTNKNKRYVLLEPAWSCGDKHPLQWLHSRRKTHWPACHNRPKTHFSLAFMFQQLELIEPTGVQSLQFTRAIHW